MLIQLKRAKHYKWRFGGICVLGYSSGGSVEFFIHLNYKLYSFFLA